MLVADSLYRHQVAVEIQPFRPPARAVLHDRGHVARRGRAAAAHHDETILLLTVALVASKAVILAGIARLAMLPRPGRALCLGLLLSQGGESGARAARRRPGERILSPSATQRQQPGRQIVILRSISQRAAAGRGRPPAGADQTERVGPADTGEASRDKFQRSMSSSPATAACGRRPSA